MGSCLRKRWEKYEQQNQQQQQEQQQTQKQQLQLLQQQQQLQKQLLQQQKQLQRQQEQQHQLLLQQQQQNQQPQQYLKQQQVQLQTAVTEDAEDMTVDVIVSDEFYDRNDESQTVDLLREAFNDEKVENFEKFLSQLNTIPKFCRIYSVNKVDTADGFVPTYFNKPLDRGGHPYFCPVGWRRYSINLGMTQDEFNKEFDSWPIVYHGTDPLNVSEILNNGMKPSDMGCFLKEEQRAVYLSPSIEYAGHPRYARIMRLRNGHYMQICLQIRIKSSMVTQARPGTLPGAFARCDPIDPNFKDNTELEWLIHWEPKRNINKVDGLVIYGLMLRIKKCHPYKLPQNKWWKHWLDKGFNIPYLDD